MLHSSCDADCDAVRVSIRDVRIASPDSERVVRRQAGDNRTSTRRALRESRAADGRWRPAAPPIGS